MALIGFTLMSVGDAIVKSMAGEWPAPAIAALRYTLGAIGFAIVVAARHGRTGFHFPRPWLQLGRAAAVSLATICFFLGVMAMPLADATAIQFTSPILTALLSGIVLRERVPAAAAGATLLAFAGVLVVLRPNVLELGAAAFFPLGAAFGMSWLIMFNRKSAGDAPVLVMQFALAVFAAPLLIAAATLLSMIGGPGFAVPMPSLAGGAEMPGGRLPCLDRASPPLCGDGARERGGDRAHHLRAADDGEPARLAGVRGRTGRGHGRGRRPDHPRPVSGCGVPKGARRRRKGRGLTLC
jgi:drug/metabolite transporter (DMT)-like permease